MYTFSHLCKVVALLALTQPVAFAQNLVSNSTFDDGIEDWWTSAGVEWASIGYDHGSLHLASQMSESEAEECVEAQPGVYVLTARVYSHCVGDPVSVLWASKADCSDAGLFSVDSAHLSSVDNWEPLAITMHVTSAAPFAAIVLYSDGSCDGGVYFDDVMLQPDPIFGNGFGRSVVD